MADLMVGRVKNGVFTLVGATVKAITLPNDATGFKMYSENAFTYALNETPEVAGNDVFTVGGFYLGGYFEVRSLQGLASTSRVLNILSATNGTVVVETFGE